MGEDSHRAWQRSQSHFGLSFSWGIFTQPLLNSLGRVTSGPDITKCMIVILLISYLYHLPALHFLTHFLVWILRPLSNATSLLNKLKWFLIAYKMKLHVQLAAVH